jgi:hypothetical protein
MIVNLSFARSVELIALPFVRQNDPCYSRISMALIVALMTTDSKAILNATTPTPIG